MHSVKSQHNPDTVTYLREFPDCDVCRAHGITRAARYDAKTRAGVWASLCQECFDRYGGGLGVGKGQKLFVLENPDRPKPKPRRRRSYGVATCPNHGINIIIYPGTKDVICPEGGELLRVGRRK